MCSCLNAAVARLPPAALHQRPFKRQIPLTHPPTPGKFTPTHRPPTLTHLQRPTEVLHLVLQLPIALGGQLQLGRAGSQGVAQLLVHAQLLRLLRPQGGDLRQRRRATHMLKLRVGTCMLQRPGLHRARFPQRQAGAYGTTPLLAPPTPSPPAPHLLLL